MKRKYWWLDGEELAEAEFFEDLEAKLKRQEGTTLTATEYEVLLTLIRDRPHAKRQRGRPPGGGLQAIQRAYMSLDCNRRVDAGASVKDAVAATALAFGVSEAAVRKARDEIK
jgi:hypothetical protein